MMRSKVSRLVVVVAFVCFVGASGSHELHADAGHCDHCNCSASALDDDWHWGTCGMDNECYLHDGTKCTNIGDESEG